MEADAGGLEDLGALLEFGFVAFSFSSFREAEREGKGEEEVEWDDAMTDAKGTVRLLLTKLLAVLMMLSASGGTQNWFCMCA